MFPGWANTTCGKFRLDADVSSDADYLTGIDTYDTTGALGWSTIGGTSFSAPTIAAEFALAGGAHGINYPALTLYAHNSSSALYDVTVGGNGYCGGKGAAGCGNVNNLGDGPLDCDYNGAGTAVAAGNGACDAAPGYDGPTGVGTPNSLAAFAASAPAATVTGPVLATPGTAATFGATVADPFPGGAPATYTWNWGDGTANTTVSSTSLTNSTPHTFTAGGVNRTITMNVKDNYGVGVTKTFVVSVCCAGERRRHAHDADHDRRARDHGQHDRVHVHARGRRHAERRGHARGADRLERPVDDGDRRRVHDSERGNRLGLGPDDHGLRTIPRVEPADHDHLRRQGLWRPGRRARAALPRSP